MSSSDTTTYKRMMSSLKTAAKWVFWIVGLVVLGGTTYFVYNNMNRPIAGMLIFMGGVLALYFYYVKWFIVPESAKWPPYQTPCPDYLTLISPGASSLTKSLGGAADVKYKCVDFVGVSTTGTLRKSNPGSLDSQLMNPSYAMTIDPTMEKTELKQKIDSNGLTWTSLFGDSR